MKIWFTQLAKPFHDQRTVRNLVKEWRSGDIEQRSYMINRPSVAGLIGCLRPSDEPLDVGNENEERVVPFGKFFSSETDSPNLVVHVGDEVDGNELSGVCLLQGPDSLKNVVSYVLRSECTEYGFPYVPPVNDSSSSDDEDEVDYYDYDDDDAYNNNNVEEDVMVAAVIPKMLPFSYNDNNTLPHDDEYYKVITKAYRYLIEHRNGTSLHIKVEENSTHEELEENSTYEELELNPTLSQDFHSEHQGNLSGSVFAELSPCSSTDKKHAGTFVENVLRMMHGTFNHKRARRESIVNGRNDDA